MHKLLINVKIQNMVSKKRIISGLVILFIPLFIIFLVLNFWALLTYFFSSYNNTSTDLTGIIQWMNVGLGALGLIAVMGIPVCIILGLYFLLTKQNK